MVEILKLALVNILFRFCIYNEPNFPFPFLMATDTYDMKFNLGRDCEARFGQDF